MQEIFIHKQGKDKKIMLVQDGHLREYYEENEDKIRLEGNIYLGKVKDVLPGMQAAFVDIGEEKNSYIHISDILPKMSESTGNKEEDFSKYPIKEYIKQNDNILVQVKKDENNHKGARITTHIHISGKFVVLMTECKFITVSQKIEKEEERERLKGILENILANEPTKYGFIIRTAALGKDEELIKKDVEQLIKKWNRIKEQASKLQKQKAPIVILKKNSIVEKIIIDLAEKDLNKIWVNDKNLKISIENIIKEQEIQKEISVELQENNLLKVYDLEEQIEKSKNRKIWLKCGGFITIDKTEALTAIDVNSGKYTGSKANKELEKTVLKVNEEATVEIAKQLRLKDIGGIIIIDYIDMQEKEHKERIIKLLQENLKKDRAKTQIMEFTQLNLLEMTRKQMFMN